MNKRVSLVVAMLSALALLWIVVPGEAVKEWRNEGFGPTGGGSSLAWVDYEHGWPFVYLRRSSPEIGRWSFTHHVTEFDIWALVCDAGISLLAVALLAGASVMWMRRTKSPRQFSLSSVFAGFVFVALALGWWRWMATARHDEQALIARIEAIGGTVETGFVGPAWLRKLVGRDGLQSTHRAVGVRLFLDEYDHERLAEGGGKDQVRAMIREIPSFTYCKGVELVVPGEDRLVTDEEVAAIAGMKRLQVLNLAGSNMTDRGLRSIAPLAHLTLLHIADTQVSDAGMKCISILEGLEELNVGGTKITDQGLKAAGKLRKLRFLNVNRTRVTDEGLKHLAGLTALENVEACDTGITERGAEQFKATVRGVSIEY